MISGLALLEALKYDNKLVAAIIAMQEQEVCEQLLDSIPASDVQKNVSALVWRIQEALGKNGDYAKDIHYQLVYGNRVENTDDTLPSPLPAAHYRGTQGDL